MFRRTGRIVTATSMVSAITALGTPALTTEGEPMRRLSTRALSMTLRLPLKASLVVIVWALSAGAQDISSCSECTCAGDGDGDGKVTIAEVVGVVNNALHGCPQFRWYLGCPPRVPGNQVCPPSVAFCTTEEVGGPCGEPEAGCCQPESRCAGGQCNAPLVCTDKDPRNPPEGRCSLISRRRFKHDIEYLAQGDLERLRSKLLGMNLTRFRYKSEPPSTAPHLGFIIEDVEPSPSVDSQNDAVDLYGYVSMAVATIQVQEGEIQALRHEIDSLRRQMGRLEGSSQ